MHRCELPFHRPAQPASAAPNKTDSTPVARHVEPAAGPILRKPLLKKDLRLPQFPLPPGHEKRYTTPPFCPSGRMQVVFWRGRLVAWAVLGWLLGPIWLSPARAQTEEFPLIASPAQRPAFHGPRPHDPLSPAVPRQFTDIDGQTSAQRLGGPFSSGALWPDPALSTDCYQWQLLPNGLLYKSYLAGGREPRIDSQWAYMPGHGWLWDATLGGKVGLVRYGTTSEGYPEGFQLDVEGAVFLRMDLRADHDRELMAADFRVGVPWTVRQGPWEGKLAYSHLSSHLGDEFMEMYPLATRINYVRDCVVLGIALRPHRDLRLYTEAGWAFYTDGSAEPWEFQFGIDYSPVGPSGVCGAPFFAINGHLREEVDFGGGLTVQTGWQWRGRTGHLLRAGMHYFNGMSNQRQFFTNHEELIGLGVWYDY